MLGTNHRLHLSHMATSYIWLQETNQRINQFSIGYMINPNLNTKKAFGEQVTLCLKNTFGTSTMALISKIFLKANTRVLSFVIFNENREKNIYKMFRVLSFVFYTIISKYVCID